MKKLFLSLTLLSSSALSLAEEQAQIKIQKLCDFFIEHDFVKQDHLCHQAIEQEDILDELTELKILDHVEVLANHVCTVPAPYDEK